MTRLCRRSADHDRIDVSAYGFAGWNDLAANIATADVNGDGTTDSIIAL